jgi:hypothetical protein
MNRAELQALAELRVKDAEILLNNGCFAGAYYLVGYAVECGLKACIAKQFHEHDIPDKKLVLGVYEHDLVKLLTLSGNKSEHELAAQGSADFRRAWETIKKWTPEVRYDPSVSEQAAREAFTAVTDANFGVMPWIKKYW